MMTHSTDSYIRFRPKWVDQGVCRRSLTHWGWVTHICGGKLIIIGSDNGLSPGRRHYLIRCWDFVHWTLRNKLQWHFNRNSNIFIKKMRLKMSAKWRPFCLGLNVLTAANVDADQTYTFSRKTGSLSFCHNKTWIFNCPTSFPQW